MSLLCHYHTSNSHECMRVIEEVLIAVYIQKAVFFYYIVKTF